MNFWIQRLRHSTTSAVTLKHIQWYIEAHTGRFFPGSLSLSSIELLDAPGDSPRSKGNLKKKLAAREMAIGVGVSIGVVVGAVIGNFADDVGLWIAICIAIGAGIGASVGDRKSAKTDDTDSD